MADILRSVSKHELRGSDAFDDAFARLEKALASGYAERMNSPDKDWFWVPAGRFLFKRQLRDSLLTSWRADYEARRLQSDLCVMAELKQTPGFGDVQEHWKLPLW